MPITVCGLHNVMNHIGAADFVVSINDPGEDSPIKNHTVSKVIVNFWDVEIPSGDDFTKMIFSVKSILRALDENKLTLDSNIVVHCRAGVSRSSAIAWLILIKLGMDYKDAFTLLFKQHSNIWPNTVVLGIGADLMRLPEEFKQFIQQVDVEIASNHSGYLGYGG